MNDNGKILYLASVRGFCAWARSALAALDELVSEHPEGPVCVLHELVHNRMVTETFESRGVRFLSSPEEIPAGASLLIGAHGIIPEQEREARRRALRVVDTTCPQVRERQQMAAALERKDTLILIGYPGHAEVSGILARSGAGRNIVISSAEEAERLDTAENPVAITQTTFDGAELERCRAVLAVRCPGLRFCCEVCRASRERQRSVGELARQVEAVVVAGAHHSSNARRLCAAAERCGVRAVLAERVAEIPPELFALRRVGLTAGASTPDEEADAIIAAFAAASFRIVECGELSETEE